MVFHFSSSIPSVAKQAAEKGLDSNEKPQKHTSRPEGPLDFVRLIPGLKPRPTTRASFSAACTAHALFGGIYGTTEVVPFQNIDSFEIA
jgi:hypothetical protein